MGGRLRGIRSCEKDKEADHMVDNGGREIKDHYIVVAFDSEPPDKGDTHIFSEDLVHP